MCVCVCVCVYETVSECFIIFKEKFILSYNKTSLSQHFPD